VYTSPCLQSAPGSTHGYDTTDFKAVSLELGGESGRELFVSKLRECGMGQVLDIVPNHMSLAQNNPYWRDVLENGPESCYAAYFDMDWVTGEERLRDKVLLPLLADQYGVVLKSGCIRLTRTGTRLEIVFDGNRLPVAPHSMSAVLASAAEAMRSETLAFLADALGELSRAPSDSAAVRRKTQRNTSVLLTLLTRYLSEKPEALDAMDDAVAAVNADVDRMDEFLEQQHYRLAHWKTANQNLGYRRFFDVNSLIGVRVDQPEVFADTHELVLHWLRAGEIDGLRVDHADGLRDPQAYFDRLRESAPDAWIVAEKILARNESLRENWPIAGTTGYEFLNRVNGLLVSAPGLAELDAIYARFLGDPVDYPTLVHDCKIAVTAEMLGSDVNWLTSIFVEICERDRDHRDHTRAEIRHAIREIAACFSVYRTYVSPQRDERTELDAAILHNAIEVASQRRPDIDRGLFEFFEDVLLMRRRGALETEFLLRLQQFTGPVMAKGFEDTALYRYNRLVAVNEVGCDPFDPTVGIEEFHRLNERAHLYHPEGMVTLATHDTKRGEDARARLAVLSELPKAFAEAVDRWFTKNGAYRQNGCPDPNTEYLYYQTLIGSWPLDVDRALLYMEKAAREAKQQTSWTQNNTRFEEQLGQFIRLTLTDEDFVTDIASFVQLVEAAGRINSLAQTLLKCTSPGVPDLYQGSELWDHRLVDPDNRGPVDFELRRRMLEEMQHLTVDEVLRQMDTGMPKLWTIQRALQTRQRFPECFGSGGDYTAVEVGGEKREHAVAFLRGSRVATVVPRLSVGVAGGWGDTRLTLSQDPLSRWTNVLTGDVLDGREMTMAALLSRFPVALLVRED
jgi:(1->4)-alpha-D-glucan 1-alpha-D-glucosylmutase